jgi:hypothetical protein
MTSKIEKSVRDAAREYLALIGAKGGKVTGETKVRDPAHYKRLADMKRAAAKARAKAR